MSRTDGVERRRSVRATEPGMVPFNRPFLTGNELAYIRRAHANGHLAGQGEFARRSAEWMESWFGSRRALLTHSWSTGSGTIPG